MQTDQPRIVLSNLPTTIRGFVYLDSDFTPVIVLNSNLTIEINRQTLRHELEHIARGDMFNSEYDEYGGA